MEGLPTAGDIVWVEFDPIRGSEQGGRRPAIVLSETLYHDVSSRSVVCPITSVARPWPFNIALPAGMRTTGFVLVDQVRTVHRPTRMFDWLERAPDGLLRAVRRRLAALLGVEFTFADMDLE